LHLQECAHAGRTKKKSSSWWLPLFRKDD